MLLKKFDPFREMKDLEKRMLNAVSSMEESPISGFVPVVNTREGEFAYHVEADLPGVKKEDINIDVSDGVLTITGERSHKEEVKEEDYYKFESNYGKFQRSFSLPAGVDTENISASSDNGVLEVIVPKLEKQIKEKKKIEVK